MSDKDLISNTAGRQISPEMPQHLSRPAPGIIDCLVRIGRVPGSACHLCTRPPACRGPKTCSCLSPLLAIPLHPFLTSLSADSLGYVFPVQLTASTSRQLFAFAAVTTCLASSASKSRSWQ